MNEFLLAAGAMPAAAGAMQAAPHTIPGDLNYGRKSIYSHSGSG
jgi:hypothetical protein